MLDDFCVYRKYYIVVTVNSLSFYSQLQSLILINFLLLIVGFFVLNLSVLVNPFPAHDEYVSSLFDASPLRMTSTSCHAHSQVKHFART